MSSGAASFYFALFVAYHALQVALFALGAHRATRPGSQRRAGASAVVATAACWVTVEWLFPRVIPWYLADAAAASPRLRQAADLGGVHGLGLLIAAVNTLVAELILAPRLRLAGAVVALLAASLFYGELRLRQWSDASPIEARASPLRISLVQGGAPWVREPDARAVRDAWRAYERLTRTASAAGSDLIVWPETTLRVYLRQNGEYLALVGGLVGDTTVPLLVGALDLQPDGTHELNSAYLFLPGEPNPPPPARIYHKRRLLPFGEWVPAGLRWGTTGRFAAAAPDSPIVLGLPRSTGPSAMTVFAPSICFEAILPGAFNAAVREGAGFLVNITDDAWFGDTDEPYQHLNGTILRAVETRRWLVRASGSGISAFISPTGEVAASLPHRGIGILAHNVEAVADNTPYVRLGPWVAILSLFIVAVQLGRRRVPRGGIGATGGSPNG